MSNNSSEVRIYKTKAGGIAAQTPYHPDLPKRFKALGGKWHSDAGVWTFDIRDEARVRAVVEDVFGSLEESGRLVTLRYKVTNASGNPVRLAGRVIAERRGRDSAVALGRGVVVVEGYFPNSGGSRNNPSIGLHYGDAVIVEIRDVDANVAAKMVAEGAEIIS